jgi:cytochrome c biogenesis protein CcmG/thiol:disulfide interchange protein DsbE
MKPDLRPPFALIVILLMGLGFVIYDTLREHVTQVGDTAPAFEVTATNGKSLTRDDFGGKILMLNFWATWCPPCIEETPRLNALQEELAKDGVVVLGISVDKSDKAYKKFIDRMKVKFPTAHDPEARISARYGTFKFPETYIINSAGKVLAKYEGEPAGTWLDPKVIEQIRAMR